MKEEADLQDSQLVVSKDQARFSTAPAVHFLEVVSGTDDQKLLHCVKTEGQLAKLGAEHMADSVVLGETAYQVEDGYLAEVEAVSAPPQKKQAVSQGAQMLADLFLELP